ncbi:Lrp/AsnC ligand binding domain-containing protein [Psychrobacter sp. AH5]
MNFIVIVNGKNMQDYHQFIRNLLTHENNVRSFSS